MLAAMRDKKVAGARFTPRADANYVHSAREMTVGETLQAVENIVTLRERVEDAYLTQVWRWALPPLQSVMAQLRDIASEGISPCGNGLPATSRSDGF